MIATLHLQLIADLVAMLNVGSAEIMTDMSVIAEETLIVAEEKYETIATTELMKFAVDVILETRTVMIGTVNTVAEEFHVMFE